MQFRPKGLLKSILRKIGFELLRAQPRDAFLQQYRAVTARQPIIFDVGAHKGKTIERYLALFNNASIFAFEPSPHSYEYLNSRFSSDDRIKIFRLALADKFGSTTFHCNRGSDTNSLLPVTSEGRKLWGPSLEPGNVIEVDTTSLDAFCRDHQIRHVDILKIDIQGAEHIALKGARTLLKARSISVIFLEHIFHDTYEGQMPLHVLLGFLHKHGYYLHNIYDLVSDGSRLVQCDLMFLPMKSPSTI